MQEFNNEFEQVFDQLSSLYDQTSAVPEVAVVQIEPECAKQLIKALKQTAINFRTLHRHLKGGNWFTIHELLGDWYDAIDEFEDKFVENLMSLGIEDQPISCDCLLEIKDYTEEEALSLVKETLDNIKDLSVKTREQLQIPTSIAPIFDELEQFIEIEADYKLSRYFTK